MLDPARMEDVLRRGDAVAGAVSQWRAIDERRRRLQAELDAARAERNAANETMARLDKKSPEFAAATACARAMSLESGDTASSRSKMIASLGMALAFSSARSFAAGM